MEINFKLVGIILLIIALAVGAIICWPKKVKPKITLVVWNMWDDSESWKNMMESYTAKTAADPNMDQPIVKIDYSMRSFDGYEKYEQTLNDAMAIDQGPDIFVIHNDWLDRYKEKIVPFDGGARGARDYERQFVDVVSSDFLFNNKIYAIPLSVDTMALYYNIDILKSAGIYDPPKTWDEFKADVARLTVFDDKANIIRAGAAIGTEKNINRSTDILALLMLQSGSPVTDPDRRITVFNEIKRGANEVSYTTGEMALQFYTDFANPNKTVYTWNPMMDYSIDAFYQGRAAMMLNYSYHIPTIRSKAPKLNFAIAPMPQITGTTQPVNIANYWAMTVSMRSKYQEEAWKFLTYLSNPDVSKTYLTKTGKPTAQKDIAEWQERGADLNMAVFAKQSITAKSWFQVDPAANEAILSEAIKNVVIQKATPKEANESAALQINETMRRKQ